MVSLSQICELFFFNDGIYKKEHFFAGCSLDGVEDLLRNLILMFPVILFHTHELNIVSKQVPTPKPQVPAKLPWHTEGSMWHSLSVAPQTCIYLDDYDPCLWSLHLLSRISMLETCILSIVRQITRPGWMHETSAQAWCTGKTQRDRVEGVVGGGIGMENTCNSMADSCQCMTKPTTIL